MIQKLKISPNTILNLNKLETGISFLKQENIVKNFSYNIHYHHRGLIVNIKYSVNDDFIIYFYDEYHANNIQKNTSNILQLLIQVIYFLKNFSINEIKNKIAHINYTKYSFLKLEYTYFWDFIKNFKIQMNKSTSYSRLQIKLSDLKIIHYISDGCILYNYYNLYYTHYKSIFNHIKIINSNSFIKQMSDLQIRIKNFTIKIKYHLRYNIRIVQKLTIQYSQEQIRSIYKYCTINSSIQKSDFLYNIYKTIAEKKLYISLQLIHQIINDKYIYDIVKYPYFNFSLLMYLNLDPIKPIIYMPYIYQYILLNYNLVIDLPPIAENVKQHTFIFKLKFNIYNVDKYLLLRQLNNNYINLKNAYNFKIPYGIHYLLNAKYKISTIKYISTYIFINYIKSFSYKIHSFHNANNKKLLHKNHIIIGFGIQVYIPLKQIPELSCEYYINDHSEKFFHISTYVK
uniref:Uncharacterized protein n=1 Tax=Gracilariopsis mclachlanii TaxID=486813 RepID=A0A345UA32_9FLOR|nr:hypothetical protein [Gracilariopsis mclachlanii]AXI97318.1 hypothetical protein [Gracilariopsis mclachlanii]